MVSQSKQIFQSVKQRWFVLREAQESDILIETQCFDLLNTPKMRVRIVERHRDYAIIFSIMGQVFDDLDNGVCWMRNLLRLTTTQSFFEESWERLDEDIFSVIENV